MASTRSVISPGVFAEDATTTIPATPIQGVSYRDPAAGPASAADGWPFFEKVNSAEFNQQQFQYSTLIDIMDKQGLLGWTDLVDYAIPAIVFGSDGLLYIALQSSGPSTAPQDPVSAPTFWRPLLQQGFAIFTTVGVTNWTVPPMLKMGYRRAEVTVVGGGGGGGAGQATTSVGSPGASAGWAVLDVNLTGVTTVAVTVGAGGASGVAGAGGNGGTSSFGAFVSATGGQGGAQGSSATVAAPGVGTGGNLNFTGNGGEAKPPNSQEASPGRPGPFGGAGAGGRWGTSVSGRAGASPGASGSGGVTDGSGAGGGADGIVIVRW